MFLTLGAGSKPLTGIWDESYIFLSPCGNDSAGLEFVRNSKFFINSSPGLGPLQPVALHVYS